MSPRSSRFARAGLAVILILLAAAAGAEPITLKLSFFTSDRSQIYQNSVKPFVDAVNAADAGGVHVEVFFSGAISGDVSRLPQLVAEGAADLALTIPGRTPDRFRDTSLLELPGLFRGTAEASRVYTQLARNGMLSGYEDFFVVDGEVSGGESIHSRKPIASLADLKGLTIRVNNPTEADVLRRLGAVPVLLSINQTAEALSKGIIDAAAFPPSMLPEFGISRVATHHYMIGLGGAPVALLMNRRKFAALAAPAQAVIRRYGGCWLSDSASKRFDQLDREMLAALEADPRRTVVFPTAADERTIRAAFKAVIEQWAAASEHHRELLARVHAELAKPSACE